MVPRVQKAHRLRLCALGLAVVAMVVAVADGSASGASTSRCPAGALRLRDLGTDGAAGLGIDLLRFELRRPGACTLRGYPGVTLLDGRRKLRVRLGRHTGVARPRTVRLDAHHPAVFEFLYEEHYASGSGALRACPIKVTGLSVIPPGDGQAVRVRLRRPLGVCRNGVRNGVKAVGSKRALVF